MSAFKVLSEVVLLVLMSLSLASSQATPTLPSLPNQFYTFVTTNFLTGGFTDSWEEYVDLTNNRYRYEGRFTDPNVIQVLQGNSLTIWATTESVPCTTVTLNATQSWRYRPAYNWYFSMLTFSGATPVYSGISTAARGIQAYTWSASGTFSRNTSQGWTYFSNFTTTYYWSVPYAYYQSPNSVPIRIEQVGANYNVTSSGMQKINDIDNVVTFVSFREVTSFPANTFQLPSVLCQVSSSFPSVISFPGPYNVQDPPVIGSQTVPRLPYDFSTQIEGKFQLTPQGGTTTTTVLAGQWTFYMPSYASTRLEKWEPAYYDDTTFSEVYNYTSVIGQDGRVYAGIEMEDNNGSCSAELIHTQWDSPLCINDACFIPELFTRQTFLLDKVTYIGRQEADGVDCDVYQKTGIEFDITDDNGHSISYQFTSNIFYYPQGWQIVGLEQSQGSFYSLPVLIQNTGNIIDKTAGTTTAYSDSWSFYIMNDENPDLSVFNPTTACSSALVIPTQSPGGSQSSSSSNDVTAGAIAGAVIGAVLGSILISLFCYCFKKSFDQKKSLTGGNTGPTSTASGGTLGEVEAMPTGAGDRVRLQEEDP